MALKVRRGLKADFLPSKLVAGELAIITDTGEMHYCFSAGNVKKLATEEDLQTMLNASSTAHSALLQLIADLELNPSELTNILANISALQADKLDKTGNSQANTVSFSEAATDTDIATGESHSTIFGKILKSIKTLRTGKISTTKIADNLTTEDATFVLSAKQGKVLNDNLAVISAKARYIATNKAMTSNTIKNLWSYTSASGSETLNIDTKVRISSTVASAIGVGINGQVNGVTISDIVYQDNVISAGESRSISLHLDVRLSNTSDFIILYAISTSNATADEVCVFSNKEGVFY